MIFSPSDVRLAIGNPTHLVARRQAAQLTPARSFVGDPTASKLESLLRQYHRGETRSETLTLAHNSFRTWLANPRMKSRAEHALEMLESYFEYDTRFPGGEVIELFRRSEIEVGDHLVRLRRDVLFFGLSGHKLRNLSWRAERIESRTMILMMCPVVLSADQELGRNRLEELQYWQMRPQVIDTVDVSACRRALTRLERRLDTAAELLIEAGLQRLST